MRSFLAVVKRELRAYFVSPLGWVVLAFFLVVQGFFFWLILGILSDPRAAVGATPFGIFFNSIVFWLTVLFVAPLITMRLISEERRTGSIESLMTAPIDENRVVLAKFLSAWAFYAFLWLPVLIYPVVISRYTALDWGPIASSYVGILGIGALFLAVGLLGSAFSKNQIVAAMTSFALTILLFAASWTSSLLQKQGLIDALNYMSLTDHMEEFSKGIVDSRRLIYYATTCALFLFLTGRTLAAKKWR
jgi:ABC-2 type transport system permease protein